jgi:hypothetical protein
MGGVQCKAGVRLLAVAAVAGCAALARAQAPAHPPAQASAQAPTPAVAQPHGLPFAGRWLRDEQPGARPRYPVLVIDKDSMTWRGADKATPDCVQPFTLRPETPGSVYTDGQGRKFVAAAKGSFPTYLLDLGAGSCGAGAGAQVRISYPLAYDVAHIEFIDYANGKPVGVRRFHRKP